MRVFTLLWLFVVGLSCTANGAMRSIAFHYGANAPLDELHAFDVAVVDPDHGFDPMRYRTASNELFAYVSVGEVNPSRSYAKLIRPAWRLGANQAWGSTVMDQSDPAWRAFFVEQIVAPLWDKGFRGFFLDTLDSYQLGGENARPAEQKAGLITLIRSLTRRFPGIRLIANRGFELFPDIGSEIEAVAAESVFRGWDAGRRAYRDVNAEDSAWIQARLNEIKQRYGVPVVAIDYVPPANREQARATAERLRRLGYIPWVADSDLATLGIGTVEVIPRRILVPFDSREAPGVHYRAAHRFIEMPLNYMGYVADYVDINQALPNPDHGIYQGIAIWLDGDVAPGVHKRYLDWIHARVKDGWHIALFGVPGFGTDAKAVGPLGLQPVAQPSSSLTITEKADGVGYELPPLPRRQSTIALRIQTGKGQTLLQLRDSAGHVFDGAGLTPWGGFVWNPFAVEEYSDKVSGWVIDPWKFLQKALALPALPVPDTTSDAGRRMLFAHMDGDGFPSKAEFPGSPYASQVVVDQILRRYPHVPHTMSVIEGEVSPAGLYPAESAALESIAKQMFALPNVEIASHTYSHPFRWSKVEAGDASEEIDADYHLQLKAYVPSLERELKGSVDYIQTRLAPPGKPVKVLLWSGDAAPSARAVEMTKQLGLLNMNGGNTIASRASPSITQISPLGARQGDSFQVFAPVSNENVYTNLWRGPFYGFRNVIETFQLTESPRRIKPIDIYYHTYSASKPAALIALQTAYDWSISQTVHPVFASQFMQIADSFNHVVVARDNADGGFVVRNAGALRSFRAPTSLGQPETSSGTAIAGWNEGPDGRYLILSGPDARLRFVPANTEMHLASANANVTRWDTDGKSTKASFSGHAPIEFDLARADGCAVTTGGRKLSGTTRGDLVRFRLSDASATINISCSRQ